MSLRTRTIFLLATLAALAVLGSVPFSGPVGHASPASFTLFGTRLSGWGFTSTTVMSPGPDLTVAAGETVNLSLTSGDGFLHNWGVDYDGDGSHDSEEPISSNFSTSTSFTFAAAPTPGTYQYYCFIHLSPMVGSFIVLPPPPDFAIGAGPPTVGPLNVGVQGTSTITVTSLNGFTGTVDLTTSQSTGLSASVIPSSVTGGSGSSTLTVSAATAGTYTVTVTGTSGSLSHSVGVTVNVVAPDFSLSATSTLSVPQGSSGDFTVNLQSLGGFSGDIALTVTVAPGGPSASASPATVTLAQGGAGRAVVTVSAVGGVYSTVAAGVYMVKVTGTSGSVSHSIDVALTVTSQGSSAVGNFPLSYLVGAVVVVGAVTVTVFLVRRGRPKK